MYKNIEKQQKLDLKETETIRPCLFISAALCQTAKPVAQSAAGDFCVVEPFSVGVQR